MLDSISQHIFEYYSSVPYQLQAREPGRLTEAGGGEWTQGRLKNPHKEWGNRANVTMINRAFKETLISECEFLQPGGRTC